MQDLQAMSAVSLLSSTREKSTNQSQKDGSHHEGEYIYDIPYILDPRTIQKW